MVQSQLLEPGGCSYKTAVGNSHTPANKIPADLDLRHQNNNYYYHPYPPTCSNSPLNCAATMDDSPSV